MWLLLSCHVVYSKYYLFIYLFLILFFTFTRIVLLFFEATVMYRYIIIIFRRMTLAEKDLFPLAPPFYFLKRTLRPRYLFSKAFQTSKRKNHLFENRGLYKSTIYSIFVCTYTPFVIILYIRNDGEHLIIIVNKHTSRAFFRILYKHRRSPSVSRFHWCIFVGNYRCL